MKLYEVYFYVTYWRQVNVGLLKKENTLAYQKSSYKQDSTVTTDYKEKYTYITAQRARNDKYLRLLFNPFLIIFSQVSIVYCCNDAFI